MISPEDDALCKRLAAQIAQALDLAVICALEVGYSRTDFIELAKNAYDCWHNFKASGDEDAEDAEDADQ